MNNVPEPLQSLSNLDAYCDNVVSRVERFAAERVEFLQSAIARFDSLIPLAMSAENFELVSELNLLCSAARHELEHFHSKLGSLTQSKPVIITPMLVVADETKSAPVPSEIVPVTTVNQDYKSTPKQVARPVANSVPAVAKRTLGDIYADVDWLTKVSDLGADVYKGTVGLIRLKALLCRQRALQSELMAMDIQHWPLRQILNHLRRRIDEEHGQGHYLIPLRAELWPTSPWPWLRLAHLYDRLADAEMALDWYDDVDEELDRSDLQEFLEALAAQQTRLWRHLQGYFPRQNDEHQINFFRELCAIAEEEDIYLFNLQDRCSDEVLEAKAEDLCIITETLKCPVEFRNQRRQFIAQFKQTSTQLNVANIQASSQELFDLILKGPDSSVKFGSKTMERLVFPYFAVLCGVEGFCNSEVHKIIETNWQNIVCSWGPPTSRLVHLPSDSENDQIVVARSHFKSKKVRLVGRYVSPDLVSLLHQTFETSMVDVVEAATALQESAEVIGNSDIHLFLLHNVQQDLLPLISRTQSAGSKVGVIADNPSLASFTNSLNATST